MRGLPLSVLIGLVVAGTVCSVQLIIHYSLYTTGLVAHSCKRVFIHKWLEPRVTTYTLRSVKSSTRLVAEPVSSY